MTSIQGVFVGEMAGSVLDSGGGRDELKTQFMTREGTYHLMTLAGTLREAVKNVLAEFVR